MYYVCQWFQSRNIRSYCYTYITVSPQNKSNMSAVYVRNIRANQVVSRLAHLWDMKARPHAPPSVITC